MAQAATAQKQIEPFILTRTLNAPRDVVWKAWTERDRLMQWFSPKGFVMSKSTLDLRPGGIFHYCLTSSDGKDMWGKWTIREVVKPERLVVVVSFSDEKGGMTRHPFSPDWPRETFSETTFTEQGNKTLLTIRWAPLNATEAEIRTFDENRAGMNQGWGGTMEQLEAYLTKA